jgi:hypothetical protein
VLEFLNIDFGLYFAQDTTALHIPIVSLTLILQ